jgi:hypothetical protein
MKDTGLNTEDRRMVSMRAEVEIGRTYITNGLIEMDLRV